MSLTRSLLNEFRPFFQALDDPTWSRDPYIVAPRAGSGAQDRNQAQSLSPITRTPHVHMSDEADKYVVEAEVPGVRKENLDVTIGDNGRSLTISANVAASGSTGQSPQATPAGEAPQEQQQQQASASTTDGKSSNPVAKPALKTNVSLLQSQVPNLSRSSRAGHPATRSLVPSGCHAPWIAPRSLLSSTTVS